MKWLLVPMLGMLAACETIAYVLGGAGAGFGVAKVMEDPHTVNNFDGQSKQIVDGGGGGMSLVTKVLIAAYVIRNILNFQHFVRALARKRWGLACAWFLHMLVGIPGRPEELRKA